MINCFDLISKAVNIYSEKEWYAYLYGAKGQVISPQLFRSFVDCEKDYFSQYDEKQMTEIYHFTVGKIGIDCSGYIKLITGIELPSYVWIERGINKTSPLEGTWGNMLYTTFGGTGRHIGIDIGAGRFLHCPKEGRTIEMGLIKEFPWEVSAQFPDVSYFMTSNV